MALTPQQSKLVRDTIPTLTEHGDHITTTFYRSMLRDNPDLKDHFNTVNQANGRPPRALTAVILAFANNSNHITELIPKLERMCHKHCSLGVSPEHYEIVGKYLIKAFGEVLGATMTPQVKEAWEKVYWLLAKMLIGREAQLYRDFEGWKGWRRFRIQQRMDESEDICSFYLVPEDGQRLPTFMPGQYVSVRIAVPGKGYKQSRQFSLSERPRPDYYRITVKRDRGPRQGRRRSSAALLLPKYGGGGGQEGQLDIVSNMLLDKGGAGQVVELTHPAGDFFLDINNVSKEPVVLISAGVGVAPMVSILNTLVERQPDRPISWIQGARASVPFYLHVRRVARERRHLRINIFKTELADVDLTGVTYDHDYRMDLAKIQAEDLWLRNPGAEYYICGPDLFMIEMAKSLRRRGVDGGRIRLELFNMGDAEFKVDEMDAPDPYDVLYKRWDDDFS